MNEFDPAKWAPGATGWEPPEMKKMLDAMALVAGPVQAKKTDLPPGFRGAPSDQQSCGGCAHFDYRASQAWLGQGLCGLYNHPTREDRVCDSFEPR